MNPAEHEYLAFSGYVERTYTTEWKDASGVWWRKTCQIINLGKPDRGIVATDPDAQLTDEPWEESTAMAPTAPRVAIEARKRKAQDRHAPIQELIVAYMREHGPVAVRLLMPVTGKEEYWIRKHITDRENTVYHRIIVNSHIHIWGLVGMHA